MYLVVEATTTSITGKRNARHVLLDSITMIVGPLNAIHADLEHHHLEERRPAILAVPAHTQDLARRAVKPAPQERIPQGILPVAYLAQAARSHPKELQCAILVPPVHTQWDQWAPVARVLLGCIPTPEPHHASVAVPVHTRPLKDHRTAHHVILVPLPTGRMRVVRAALGIKPRLTEVIVNTVQVGDPFILIWAPES